MSATDSAADPRLAAGVALIGHTGATAFTMRFNDDEEPTIWNALATYPGGYLVGAALDPLGAVFALLDTAIDGGTCTHCGRPTGFTEEPTSMPLDEVFCWYAWDPELAVFRRGCAGDQS